MNEDVIGRMRARVKQLRRVMDLAYDERIKQIVQQVIDATEADLRKLQAEGGAETSTRH